MAAEIKLGQGECKFLTKDGRCNFLEQFPDAKQPMLSVFKNGQINCLICLPAQGLFDPAIQNRPAIIEEKMAVLVRTQTECSRNLPDRSL